MAAVDPSVNHTTVCWLRLQISKLLSINWFTHNIYRTKYQLQSWNTIYLKYMDRVNRGWFLNCNVWDLDFSVFPNIIPTFIIPRFSNTNVLSFAFASSLVKLTSQFSSQQWKWTSGSFAVLSRYWTSRLWLEDEAAYFYTFSRLLCRTLCQDYFLLCVSFRDDHSDRLKSVVSKNTCIAGSYCARSLWKSFILFIMLASHSQCSGW